MFTVRPYKEEDAAACGDCFYEGFFSCSVDQNDKILLRDYAQILIEKCNFTYVAETEDHQVVGFICGKYDKRFSKTLAAQYETKKHYAKFEHPQSDLKTNYQKLQNENTPPASCWRGAFLGMVSEGRTKVYG